MYVKVASGEKLIKFFGHTTPVMMIVHEALRLSVPSDVVVFWIAIIPHNPPNESDALLAITLPLFP